MYYIYSSQRWLNRLLSCLTSAFLLLLSTYSFAKTPLPATDKPYSSYQENNPIACVKPNAGKDTTICTTSTQLKVPSQGEVWSFLSSSNNTSATITTGGLASNMTTTGQYRFVLTKDGDANCKDTVVVTKANFIIANLPDDDICPGTTITFGYQGLSNVSYLWSTGATTEAISVKPSQTTTYFVTVTSNTSGCSLKDTVKITVNPKPDAGADKVVCQTTTTTKAAGQGETWSFLSFNDPNNQNNTDVATIDQQGNVASLDKAGFYRFVLTNDKGCKDTIRIQRRILTLPEIQLAPKCPNTTLTFGYTNTTDFAYLWSTGDMTGQITVKPLITTDYTVEVTEKATGCTVKDTVTVTVKPAPKLELVSSVCLQDNSRYITTLTTTNGATITSNAGIISGSGTSFTVSVRSDTISYTITATLDDCQTKLNVTKPDCSCPIIANPSGQNTSVCIGSAATISASGCTVGTSLKWYSNASLTTEITTGISGNNLTTGNLNVNTDYYAACVDNIKPICKSSGIKITVTVKPLPKFSGVSTTCASNNSTYSVNVSSTGVVTVKSPSGPTISGAGPYVVSVVPAGQSLVLTSTLDGCPKDTTISPAVCQPNCPTITLLNPNASNEACSGPLYLYAGAQPIVKTSAPSDSLRFVYFTAATTNPYTGGTLMATVLANPSDSIATLDNGLPGLLSNRFPLNNTNAPITYYVYAIRKTPVVGTACPPPFVGLTYTFNPVPKFELDSIPACIGDTTFKVNVTITSPGTFKIIVGKGVVSIGNGPNPVDVLETITNVAGNGATTQIKLKTIGSFLIFVEDAKGCKSVLTAPKPSFKECNSNKVYDLALSKSINKKKAAIGDLVIYTIKVWNEGSGTATGVSVKDTLNAGVVYQAHLTAFGSYNSNTKIWTIGSIAPQDTVTLDITVKVVAEGVWFNTAEICTMNEDDEDSTPCNGEEVEDDIDRECFSVPIKLCSTEAIEVTVPAAYTNVQWTKDNDPTFSLKGNVVLLSAPGVYRFTASSGDCPAEGCCPVEIVPGECCPPDICVPFVIKQTKKGGKLIK